MTGDEHDPPESEAAHEERGAEKPQRGVRSGERERHGRERDDGESDDRDAACAEPVDELAADDASEERPDAWGGMSSSAAFSTPEPRSVWK